MFFGCVQDSYLWQKMTYFQDSLGYILNAPHPTKQTACGIVVFTTAQAVPYGRAVLRFYFFRNIKQSKNEDTVLVVEHILHFVFAVQLHAQAQNIPAQIKKNDINTAHVRARRWQSFRNLTICLPTTIISYYCNRSMFSLCNRCYYWYLASCSI